MFVPKKFVFKRDLADGKRERAEPPCLPHCQSASQFSHRNHLWKLARSLLRVYFVLATAHYSRVIQRYAATLAWRKGQDIQNYVDSSDSRSIVSDVAIMVMEKWHRSSGEWLTVISASRINICESSCIHAQAALLSLDRTTRVVEWSAMSSGRTPLDS